MIADRYTDFMYGLIEEVLAEIGPRESCSESERRLGRRLAEMWGGLGHEVRTERFRCHPKAFLGFIPLSALLYLVATVLYWISPFLCFVAAAMSFAMIFFELLRYRELVDPLFPVEQGENVVGIVRPKAEPKKRVIVSAHQDSAYEFNLWFLLRTAAVPIMVIAFAAPLVPMCAGLVQSIAGAPSGGWFDTLGFVSMALYPFVGLNLFFHTYSVVPGAMDNLAGISVVSGVARALAEERRDGEPVLGETEVILLATSSEEAGLRGAKRYVAAHQRELTEIPSFGIFVDGVYDERFLTVIRRELTTGARHDPRLVQLANRVASSHGWPIREAVIPFGGTDAAAFSLAGLSSVCLLCQDTSRLVPNYHTRHDVIDHVRPQSLGVTLQMVLDMIRAIDENRLEQ